MRRPRMLGIEKGVVAGIKDYYETTMLDANVAAGIEGRRAVFNAAVRGLRNHKVVGEKTVRDEAGTWHCYLTEKDNYLLNTGLEQFLALIESWEMNEQLLHLYSEKNLAPETIDYLKKHRKLDLTVTAIPEGIPVFGYEPVISVDGTFEQCQLPESLVLGTIGYQTAVATNASYVINILREFGREDIVTLEGGSRRTHPGAALAASRAVIAAGFNGTSLEQLGVEYPELTAAVGGSSGHSEILHIGSDELAFELQLRAYYRIKEGDSAGAIREKIAKVKGVGPTFLIDTFDSDEGLEAAIRIMKKYGIQCQVRNDSGDQLERTRHIRARFGEEGLGRARIMISDDLKPWMIYDLLRNKADFNLVLIGTYLVNPYRLPGHVYKIAADERDGAMQPVRKVAKNNPAKGTLPGMLDVYRIIGKDGKADRDVIIARGVESIDQYLKREDEGRIQLTKRVIERGELVYEVPDMTELRETTRRNLALLRDEHRRFRDAVPYPVVISDAVMKMQDDFDSRLRSGTLYQRSVTGGRR